MRAIVRNDFRKVSDAETPYIHMYMPVCKASPTLASDGPFA